MTQGRLRSLAGWSRPCPSRDQHTDVLLGLNLDLADPPAQQQERKPDLRDVLQAHRSEALDRWRGFLLDSYPEEAARFFLQSLAIFQQNDVFAERLLDEEG